jgi:hypothetical protein
MHKEILECGAVKIGPKNYPQFNEMLSGLEILYKSKKEKLK